MTDQFDPIVLLPAEPLGENVAEVVRHGGKIIPSTPAPQGLTASQVLLMAAKQAESEYARCELSSHPGVYQLVAAALMEQAKRERKHGDSKLYEMMRATCSCENDCMQRCRFLATQIIFQLVILREHDDALVRRKARLALKLLRVEIAGGSD
jgi:hypothetical protein